MSDSDRKPTLENYLSGVPLNEEMEELARQVGSLEDPADLEAAEAASGDPFDQLRPLDDADRKALLKLTQDAGWEVFKRVRLRACAEAERAAIILSQDNPLANERKIAQGWAYLAVMQQVISTEQATIEVEISKVKPKPKRRGGVQ
jgi:hypothetical protein